MEELLHQVSFYALLAVGVLIFFCLGRAVAGPTAPDRVNAINVIGTKTVIIIALISFVFRQPLYLDVAMVYALMSFITTIGVAKYMEKGALE